MRPKRPLWRDGQNLGFEECRQVAEGVSQSDAPHGVAEGATQQQLLPSALTPDDGQALGEQAARCSEPARSFDRG
jgi:hypothetical protein